MSNTAFSPPPHTEKLCNSKSCCYFTNKHLKKKRRREPCRNLNDLNVKMGSTNIFSRQNYDCNGYIGLQSRTLRDLPIIHCQKNVYSSNTKKTHGKPNFLYGFRILSPKLQNHLSTRNKIFE